MSKRSRSVLLSLFIAAPLAFSACSREKETPSLLTEEQLASDHVTLEEELTDKVTVDAEITPYERYREGLRSYYMAQQEIEWMTCEEFMENPMVGKQTLEEVTDYLRSCSALGAEKERRWDLAHGLAFIDLEDTQCAGTRRIQLELNFREGEVGVIGHPTLFYAYTFTYEMDRNNANALLQTGRMEGGELPFASPEEAEKKAREVLDTLTEWTYADYVVYTAIGSEGRDLLREEKMIPNDRLPEESRGYEEEDCYVFFFYQDVDGFPWKAFGWTAEINGDAEIGDDVVYDAEMNWAMPILEMGKMVSLDASGVRSVYAFFGAVTGEVYREKRNVRDAGEILEKVKEHFEQTVTVSPIEVTRVELMYSSWFTDPNEGPMHNAVMPFWVVRYHDTVRDKQYELVFDAYTGEYMNMHNFAG